MYYEYICIILIAYPIIHKDKNLKFHVNSWLNGLKGIYETHEQNSNTYVKNIKATINVGMRYLDSAGILLMERWRHGDMVSILTNITSMFSKWSFFTIVCICFCLTACGQEVKSLSISESTQEFLHGEEETNRIEGSDDLAEYAPKNNLIRTVEDIKVIRETESIKASISITQATELIN